MEAKDANPRKALSGSTAQVSLVDALETEFSSINLEIGRLIRRIQRTPEEESLLSSLKEERQEIKQQLLRLSEAGQEQRTAAVSAATVPDRELVDATRPHDMLDVRGGGLLTEPVSQMQKTILAILNSLLEPDCLLWLCGAFCSPCQIADAIVTDDPSQNYWLHCCCILFAPDFLGLPYFFVTLPALEALNLRLGGVGGDYFKAKTCLALCFCRPCFACQLARAVRQSKETGLTRVLNSGAPNSGYTEMTRD